MPGQDMPINPVDRMVTNVELSPEKGVSPVLLADPKTAVVLHTLTRASLFQLISGS
jgi:hypothetical protein